MKGVCLRKGGGSWILTDKVSIYLLVPSYKTNICGKNSTVVVDSIRILLPIIVQQKLVPFFFKAMASFFVFLK